MIDRDDRDKEKIQKQTLGDFEIESPWWKMYTYTGINLDRSANSVLTNSLSWPILECH